MISQSRQPLIYPDAEVIIGLVAPVGTDLGEVERKLEERLKLFGYRHQHIKLTDLLPVFGLQTKERPDTPAGCLHRKMDQGNALRDKSEHADALAVAAIRAIRKHRTAADEPEARCAFVLKQLKHPKEVETLRAVYGPGFFLLGVTASIQRRRKFLIEDRGMSEEESDKLIERDEEEDDIPRGSGHGRRSISPMRSFPSMVRTSRRPSGGCST